MNYSKDHNNQIEIKELIKTIQDLPSRRCRRPCCVNQVEDKDIIDVRLNKAKTIINSKTNRKERGNYYKNDKSEEYFKRYYNPKSFNIPNIISVTRTKR